MVENTPEGTASPTPGLGDHLRQRWQELYEQGRADRREAAGLRAELEMAAARYDMLVADLKRHRRALAAVQALVSEMLAREQPGDRRLEGGMHHADAILGGLRPRRDPALPAGFPEQYDRQPYVVPEEVMREADYEREFGPAFGTFVRQEHEAEVRRLRPPAKAHRDGPCDASCYEDAAPASPSQVDGTGENGAETGSGPAA